MCIRDRRYFVSLKLKVLPLAGAEAKAGEIAISGLPVKLHVLFAEWSPDGQHIALVNVDNGSGAAGTAGLSLWFIDVAKAHAVRVPRCLLYTSLMRTLANVPRVMTRSLPRREP